jgi:hypothetical protein
MARPVNSLFLLLASLNSYSSLTAGLARSGLVWRICQKSGLRASGAHGSLMAGFCGSVSAAAAPGWFGTAQAQVATADWGW